MFDPQLKFLYTPLRHVGSTFRIPVTTNLAGWWRWRVGYTLSGTHVVNWADQSGYGRDFATASAPTGPTVDADGGLLFAGPPTSQHLTVPGFNLLRPCTIYMAFKQVSWTANAFILTGTASSVRLQQVGASPEIDFNDPSFTGITSTASPVGAFSVVAMLADGTSSVFAVSAGSGTQTQNGSVPSGLLDGLNLGIGRFLAAPSNISVREVACYSVGHDLSTRTQLIRYFARIASIGGA